MNLRCRNAPLDVATLTKFYTGRGVTNCELQDYSAIVANLTQTITHQPEAAYNYYWHGRTYLEMTDHTTALGAA